MQEVGWADVFTDHENKRVGRAQLKAAYAGRRQAQKEAEAAVSPRDVERVLRATERLTR